eukprot:6212977-Pleurochrysis_carterae.AAC.3
MRPVPLRSQKSRFGLVSRYYELFTSNVLRNGACNSTVYSCYLAKTRYAPQVKRVSITFAKRAHDGRRLWVTAWRVRAKLGCAPSINGNVVCARVSYLLLPTHWSVSIASVCIIERPWCACACRGGAGQCTLHAMRARGVALLRHGSMLDARLPLSTTSLLSCASPASKGVENQGWVHAVQSAWRVPSGVCPFKAGGIRVVHA